MTPALYIVATPIGNLEDSTLRALTTLREVAIIYAEDTRVTRGLLQRYEITTPLRSYREAMSPQAFARVAAEVVEAIAGGDAVAYVSDAGTPGISDPGGALVAAVLAADLPVVPIPGPSAVTSLLSVSGLPLQTVLFAGFLPKKKGKQTRLRELQNALASGLTEGVVLYESPHRIVALLETLNEWELPLTLVLGRELTKRYEEVLRGTPAEIHSILATRGEVRGEIVLLLSLARS